MKTVSELAKELNISTQAVYKKINRTLQDELRPHVKTVGGQKCIDESGETIIKRGLQPVCNRGLQPDTQVANQTDKEAQNTGISSIVSLQPVCNRGLQPVANQYIYRFVSAEENILYVGLTNDLHKRINIGHFSGKGPLADECYVETETVEYTPVKDGENAEEKENYYISQYKPPYNKSAGYVSEDKIYNDEWIAFDFDKNTGAMSEKNSSVRRLEEKNKLLEESNKFFMEQNKALQDELTKERGHSRAQADKLANLASQLAELSRNNQILLGVEQRRTSPVLLMGGNGTGQGEKEPTKKKPFWSIFKKQ